MKPVISLFVSAVLLLAATGRLCAQQQVQQPVTQHSVAVLDFNGSAVNDVSQAVFGAPVDIGRGISQLLVSRLVSDGTFQVTAPARIGEILNALNLSNSAAADPRAAARIGQKLRVDAVVAGRVTQFGWDGQAVKPEGTSAEAAGRKGPAAPPMRRAMVMVTAELIDTNTGQVLATANSKGVSRRSGTKLLDHATAEAGSSPSMDSSIFAQSMIGEATTAAVNELAKELEGESANLSRWAPPPPRGQITEASGSNVTIDVGSAAGLKVGEKMLVTRVVHVERDRVTESAVGAVEDEVGVLTITAVHDDSAVGRFSGPAAPKAGDQVRPLQ